MELPEEKRKRCLGEDDSFPKYCNRNKTNIAGARCGRKTLDHVSSFLQTTVVVVVVVVVVEVVVEVVVVDVLVVEVLVVVVTVV